MSYPEMARDYLDIQIAI
ncbi:hypothetical protein [Citrobacter sp. HN-141]